MTSTNGKTNHTDEPIKVIIKGAYYGEKTLPSLNDLLREYGRHPNAGNKMKQDCMWICIAAIRKCLKGWKVENPPVLGS